MDENPARGRWILTGSVRDPGDRSLAGRTELLELLPLNWAEIQRFEKPPATLDEALLAGGFPRVFDRGRQPSRWLGSYVRTYIERDVRQALNVGDLETFRRFLESCAGRTAQLLNLASLARAYGISQPTARTWLSVLEAGYVVFRLRPFHANVRKRPGKASKLAFHDAGLACSGSVSRPTFAATRCGARRSRRGSFPRRGSSSRRTACSRSIGTATAPKWTS